MKIKELINKKREIIEAYRETDKRMIKAQLNKLAKSIETDEELLGEIDKSLELNTYIFIITDQFLICKYVDKIGEYTFCDHKITYSDNETRREFVYNIKSSGDLFENDIMKTVLDAYIKEPYFCINYENDEYLPSTIYKDLMNL